jgi:peptidoglycan/LPS O-acetylase OafA/YrhL
LGKLFPGTLGVVIFFVISGFLITRQMAVEIEETGTLNTSRFYLRRVFRLLPALLFYLLLFVPLLLCLGSVINSVHVLSGIFYFANYYHLFIGYPPYNPMPILWSLSVEEHYYIVFPLVMLLFCKNLRSAILPLSVLLFIVLLWRIFLYTHCLDHALAVCGIPGRIRVQGTDAIFDCILFGAVTSLLLHYYERTVSRFFINNKVFVVALILLVAAVAVRSPYFRETFRYSLEAACTAIIIANILFGQASVLRRWLEKKIMIVIGKLSYSLYLMHFGVLIVIEKMQESDHLNGTGSIILYLVVSFLLANCSYFLVEMPMVKLRRKFAYKTSNG